MKKILHHLLIASVFLVLLPSCGTSIKRNLSDTGIKHSTETLEGETFVFYTDNHEESRWNAEKLFNRWAEKKHLKRTITGKRLLSISPKEDGCHITFDFRLFDGTEQRVTIIVPDFVQKTYGKPKGSEQARLMRERYEQERLQKKKSKDEQVTTR